MASMIPQRYGQVWLYHGGTPLPQLLRPHGFKEHTPPLDNLEHDEVNRAENEDPAARRQIQL